MSYANGPKIVTDGLVLCLDAANRKSYPLSGSTIYDLSGQGNHGTLQGDASYSSSYGGSLVFDGTGDYVICDHPTGSSDGVTYEVLVKMNVVANKGIFTFDNATVYSGLSILSNKFIVYLSGSNYIYLTTGIGNVSIDTWYHVVFYIASGNASDVVAYINNNLITNSTIHTGSAYSPTKLYIGSGNTNSSLFINGTIPFARCYNRQLSANEISQNYNALKGRYGL